MSGVFDRIKKLTGNPYHRAFYSTDILDNYVLRKAREEGIVLPTASSLDEWLYHGAWVAEPRAGINHNVMYADLASLYPNNIRMLNVGPDTLIGTQAELEASEYTEDDCVWGYIDTRDVKRLEPYESWRDFTDGEYKIVRDSKQNQTKWTADPQYDRCYYIKPSIKEGFLRSLVQELIDLKNQYRGTPLYDPLKANIVNCFTSDTDVLTPNGVRNITELEVGDIVYSIDADTMEVEKKPVTETYSYPDYDGDIIDMQNQNIDFSVTPNHRMLAENMKSKGNECEFIEAGNFANYGYYQFAHDWSMDHGEQLEEVDITDFLDTSQYQVFVEHNVHGSDFVAEFDCELEYRSRGVHPNTVQGYVFTGEQFEEYKEKIKPLAADIRVRCKKAQKWVPKKYDGDDFLNLLAWFITEGHTDVSTKKEYENTTRGITYRFSIAQEGDDNIYKLLDRMGLTYSDSGRSYGIASEIWVRVLELLCGDNSFNKKIPNLVFETSLEQKEMFYQTMMDGDGDQADWSYRYTTSSDELRDDMMRLCVHLGRTPKYAKDSGSWRIYTGETKNSFRTDTSYERRKSDEGEGVYCVEVADNHTLLAGRNGNFQFVGNSLYGFISPQGENNSGRLAHWKIGESITLSGRKVIQYTSETAVNRVSEYYDDVYVAVADTDGAGICVPHAATRAEMQEYVGEAIEYINTEGYDEFTSETFGVDEHFMDVEIESYAPTLFVPSEDPMGPNQDIGVRKRYSQWITMKDLNDENPKEVDTISTKGLEAVRSDVADITSEAQETCFNWWLKEDRGVAKAKTFEYLRELHEDITAGNHPLAEIGKRMGLQKQLDSYGTANRKAGPIKRGAKYMNQHCGTEIRQGSKPRVFYISDTGSLPATYDADTAEDGELVDCIAVEDISNIPNEITIDYEKHTRKALVEPMRPLLKTLGWTWDDVLYDTEQSGLDSFAVAD